LEVETEPARPVAAATRQGHWLGQVVTGYFAYHAVPSNLGSLVAFHNHVTDLWRRTLRRRSQKDHMLWSDMTKLAPATAHPTSVA
jgi:RNA-directed DNA polymerase